MHCRLLQTVLCLSDWILYNRYCDSWILFINVYASILCCVYKILFSVAIKIKVVTQVAELRCSGHISFIFQLLALYISDLHASASSVFPCSGGREWIRLNLYYITYNNCKNWDERLLSNCLNLRNLLEPSCRYYFQFPYKWWPALRKFSY